MSTQEFHKDTFTVEDLTVDIQPTARTLYVDIVVPVGFREDCEKCYAVLNEALLPWGGTAAFDLWRESEWMMTGSASL